MLSAKWQPFCLSLNVITLEAEWLGLWYIMAFVWPIQRNINMVFYEFSDHWNDTGFWNPSIWKTRTHLSYTVHTEGIAWLSDTHVSFSLYCPNFMCPSMWKRKKMNNFMCLLEFECTKRLKMYSHAIPDIMAANDLVMQGARALEAMIMTLVLQE